MRSFVVLPDRPSQLYRKTASLIRAPSQSRSCQHRAHNITEPSHSYGAYISQGGARSHFWQGGGQRVDAETTFLGLEAADGGIGGLSEGATRRECPNQGLCAFFSGHTLPATGHNRQGTRRAAQPCASCLSQRTLVSLTYCGAISRIKTVRLCLTFPTIV